MKQGWTAVFDVDGTLLDSMPLWHDLAGRYLRDQGKQPRPDLGAQLKTMSLIQAAPYLIDTYELPSQADEVVAGINRIVRDGYFYTVNCKPGVKEYLRYLAKKGVSMCVASASEKTHIEAALRREEIYAFFTRIFTCAGIGKNKDDPDFFRQVAASLDLPPRQLVVYEDAYHAMTCAKTAGCQVVGVYDTDALTDLPQIVKTCDVYVKNLACLIPLTEREK